MVPKFIAWTMWAAGIGTGFFIRGVAGPLWLHEFWCGK